MDRRNSILYSALLLAGVLATLHFLAVAFYFYWIFWWYDVMMHFLAGLTGGFASYWVIFHSGLFFKTPQKVSFVILSVLLCMLIAGVAWEVLEYTHGLTDSHEGYRLDTMNDLILDSAGAVLAALIATRKRKSHG